MKDDGCFRHLLGGAGRLNTIQFRKKRAGRDAAIRKGARPGRFWVSTSGSSRPPHFSGEAGCWQRSTKARRDRWSQDAGLVGSDSTSEELVAKARSFRHRVNRYLTAPDGFEQASGCIHVIRGAVPLVVILWDGEARRQDSALYGLTNGFRGGSQGRLASAQRVEIWTQNPRLQLA